MLRRREAPRAAARRIAVHNSLRSDVTINRERVDTAAAVELLTGLVRGRRWATSDAARTLIRNRALACRVQVALALNATTRSYGVRVEAAEGLVRLEAPELVDEAVEVAREVPGVTRIVMHVAPASEIPVARRRLHRLRVGRAAAGAAGAVRPADRDDLI